MLFLQPAGQHSIQVGRETTGWPDAARGPSICSGLRREAAREGEGVADRDERRQGDECECHRGVT